MSLVVTFSEHNHVDSHDMFLTRPKHILRHLIARPLDGASLAEDSFSEALLNESGAAEEDKHNKALARRLSKLVVAEHTDDETFLFQTRQTHKILNICLLP